MRPITARDLMNPEVLTVRDSMSVGELARFLTDHEISGAPVEDASGKLVGVVSLVDLAAARRDEEREIPPAKAHFYHREWQADDADRGLAEVMDDGEHDGEELTVRDVMTPTLYTVDQEAPVSEVASAMLDGHLHRLLVTGGSASSVVGIITTSDLLGLLIEEPPR